MVGQDQSYEMPANAAAGSSDVPVANDSVETASTSRLMPVYWLENSDSGVFLFREYVQDTRHQEPIGDAVYQLLNGKPANPNWYTHLAASDDIGVSIDQNNLITLDLPAKVFKAKLDAGLSERTVQQLVFTATAAAANSGILTGQNPATVRILVDGSPNAEVFGGYVLDDVYGRNAAFVAPIWIIDPQFGASVESGSVRVYGRTSGFEGGTFYELDRIDEDGLAQPQNEAKAVNDQSLSNDGSFELNLRLNPGDYVLRVWGQDADSTDRLGAVESQFTVK